MRRLAALICLLSLLPSAHGRASVTRRTPATVRPYAHVVVVIEENKSFSTVIGNRDAPYINQLARQGVLFTDAHAITHPSQPNYVALFAGTLGGLADDSCPHELSGPNLASEMLARQRQFVLYSEDLPAAGFTGCAANGGLYRRKHNPVANWQASLPVAVNQPFSAFSKNFAQLPAVAFVVPNMMHDMHDGTIAEGDAWLKQHLDAYAQWAGRHGSLLLVTWDESDANSASNRIPMLMVGAGVKPGSSGQYVTHYSLLRSLTDMYGLKPLGDAVTATPIRRFRR